MNWRYMALLGALLLCAGVFAYPTGAAVTSVENLTRWTDTATAGSFETEGGNISAINLSTTSLTDRWAAFFGNLSGMIYLTDAVGGTSAYVYSWTAATAAGGSVCASNANDFDFTAAVAADAAFIAGLNTFFSHGDAPDNAINTYTTSCDITFVEGTITGSLGAPTGNDAADTFESCVIRDAGMKGAVCTQVQAAGTNYLGNVAQYELMVPTNPGTSLNTYYFYAELA